MDITQLILDDHHEQRRLFAILEQIDRADTATLEAIWARLSAFLEVHAAAEEEIFYPELLRVGIRTGGTGTAEAETLDAIHDHNDIRDAIAVVGEHVVGSNEWFGAVAGVNLANGDHMAEEEREGLTDFRLARRAGVAPQAGGGLRGLRGQAFRWHSAGGQEPRGLRARGGARHRGTRRRYGPGRRIARHRRPRKGACLTARAARRSHLLWPGLRHAVRLRCRPPGTAARAASRPGR